MGQPQCHIIREGLCSKGICKVCDVYHWLAQWLLYVECCIICNFLG